ncbi:MAG: transcription antitermination factor NusB, partial [Thermodesulfobacteriota bacterium]
MLASAADRQPPPEAASPPTARFIAIETLVRFHKKPQPLDTLFDKLTARHNLSGRDRSFAMNIIYGVLRHRDYLDLLLTRLLHQPINKLHPTVRQVLYSGLYQIFFLDRTPAPAAVNESVKVARQNRLPKKLCSLINGVLRQSLRQMGTLPAPDSETA